MQCASCQFENMPGTSYCGRCGTSMVLAEIDVHPPRASRFSRAWRRVSAPGMIAARGARRVRQEVRGIGGQLTGVIPTADVLLRMLVPGWPQFYNGHRAIGRLLLFAYVMLVLLGALLYGATWGSFFLGLAFGVHVWSVLQASGPADSRMLLRLWRGIGVSIALVTVVYVPLIWALSWVVDARLATADQGVLAAGDVVLVHHFRAPRVGDTVVYSLEYQHFTLGNHMAAYIGGPQMERIIAGPGDLVEVRKRTVTVNGKPASAEAMSATNVPETLKLTVPPNSYLVFPPLYINPKYGDEIRTMAGSSLYIVPAENVTGVAYWRHQPLSKWGPLP